MSADNLSLDVWEEEDVWDEEEMMDRARKALEAELSAMDAEANAKDEDEAAVARALVKMYAAERLRWEVNGRWMRADEEVPPSEWPDDWDDLDGENSYIEDDREEALIRGELWVWHPVPRKQ